MLADDDGFINSPKSIIRQCGASEDDLKILIAKKFVIPFDSGIIVIKHWRINNYLRTDRYKETIYTEERQALTLDNSGNYHLGIPSMGKPSIGKVSIGKDSIGNKEGAKRKRFTPPTLEEVRAYCEERHNTVDPQRFIDYYTANGWVQGKGKPVKDWKACVRTWERPQKGNKTVPLPAMFTEAQEAPQMTAEEEAEQLRWIKDAQAKL